MGNNGGSIVSNDFSVKGLLRSIGDSGSSPSDKAGATLLKLLDYIDLNIDAVKNVVRGIDGDTGTRIDKYLTIPASTTGVIHTVTAGKILYWSGMSMDLYPTGSAVYCYMQLRNVGDAVQWEVGRISGSSTVGPAGGNIFQPFIPAIPIPAGYDIAIVTTAAATCRGQIHGWEE